MNLVCTIVQTNKDLAAGYFEYIIFDQHIIHPHFSSQVKALRDESVVIMTLYARNGALVLILSTLTRVAGGVAVNMTMDRKQEGEGFATAETHMQTPVLLRGSTTKDVEMERSLWVADPLTLFDSPVTVFGRN